MAWFDYLGGIAGGLGQVGSQMEASREQARRDKLAAAQEARAVAAEQRQATEFSSRRAADLYNQYTPGQELDINDPDVKLLQQYYKQGLGKGSSPTKVTILETPERKQERLKNDLFLKTYDATIEKQGQEAAVRKAVSPFLDAYADPTKMPGVMNLPVAQRKLAGKELAGDPTAFMTEAEKRREAMLAPGVIAEGIQAATQQAIAAMPQRVPPGQAEQQRIQQIGQRVQALNAYIDNAQKRLSDLSFTNKAERQQVERELQRAQQELAALGGLSTAATSPVRTYNPTTGRLE